MSTILKFRAINRLSEGYKYSDEFDTLSDFFKWVEELVIVDQVEQFTGLLDKNGKEIYDGDILKFVSCSWLESQLTEQTAKITYNEKEMSWWLIGIKKKSEIKPDFEIDNNNFEIIGNEFETPELLNN